MNKISFKPDSEQFKVQICPLCSKPHHNQRDNMFTLNIKRLSGVFNCFRCGSKGNWLQFKQSVMGELYGQTIFRDEARDDKWIMRYGDTHEKQPISQPQADSQYSLVEMMNHIDNLENEIYPETIKYLTDLNDPKARQLSLETLQKFKVGIGQERFYDEESNEFQSFDVVYFPMFSPVSTDKQREKLKKHHERKLKTMNDNEKHKFNNARSLVEDAPEPQQIELVKVKVRAVGAENKHHQRTMPIGCEVQALFGLTTIP